MRVINCEQGSAEWFALRRGIPTATDFAEIVTAVKGDLSASASGLIDKLIDQLVRPECQQEEFAGNRHTERGHALEPDARRWYKFATGARVDRVGFVMRDDGRAGCSPDGIASHFDSGGLGIARCGLEIKCPDGPTHVGYVRAGGLPAKYKQQVHGSMCITGLRRWDFVSFCPGYAPLLVPVLWDAYTDKVACALDAFLDELDKAKGVFV